MKESASGLLQHNHIPNKGIGDKEGRNFCKRHHKKPIQNNNAPNYGCDGMY